jgi:site-specific recombinase XerD
MDSRGQYKVLLEVNPLVKLKKLKAPRTLTTFLSEREVEILLDHCDERNFYGRRIKISLLLLISTGMRKFEFTNIKIQDIDFNTHQIRIMGKGIKERIVPIVPGIRNQFYKYIDTRNKIMARNKQDHDSLWVSINGTANMGENTIYLGIATLAAKCGLHLTRLVHKLRNTFAAWETIKGTADYKIMQIGGWSDNSMLLHYREGLFDYNDHKDNFAQTEGPEGFYPSQVLYNKNKCTEHTHSRKDRFCSQCGKPC